jgi:hypothetical protein
MATSIKPTKVKQIQTLIEISNTNQPNSEPWNNAQNLLVPLLWSFSNSKPPKYLRLQYYSSGLIQLLISIIKSPENEYTDEVREMSWLIINNAMCCPDSHEEDNLETVLKGVDLGLIELASAELHAKPLRFEGRLLRNAFICLTSTSCRTEFVHRVVANKVPMACLEIIQLAHHHGGENALEVEIILLNIRSSIRVLNSIASYSVHSMRNLGPSLIQSMYIFLPYLTRVALDEHDQDLILIGFNAARLILRCEKQSTVVKLVSENPAILEFYPQLMRNLMNVGMKQSYNYFNSFWKIVGVALDVALLAECQQLDRNLLVPLCPLMIEMMAYHYMTDPIDIVRYGLIFLFHVCDNQACLDIIRQDKKSLNRIFNMVTSDVQFDIETLAMVNILRKVV